MTSLRKRLFVILVAATGIIWLSAVAWIYVGSRSQLEHVLDTRLQEAARMVSSLVAGGKRPIIRAIAAALLGVSMAGFIVLGIEGSVTLIVTPLALLLEALLFASFIWPAPRFPDPARRQGVAA